jgi:long-chain fatty acid transport protein
MKKRLHPVVGALLSLAMCSQAFALGTGSYSTELISARSLGEGATGTAGVQNDPVAGWTNPAALTALPGTQFTVGLTYANATPIFTDDHNQVTGARATSVFVPNFAMSSQMGDKFTAGFAVVSPYGQETHFDGDSPLRYASTDARLRIIDITPSLGYKVCDGFSVGVGADYYDTTEGSIEKKFDGSGINGDTVFGAVFTGANFGAAYGAGAAAAKATTDANTRLNGTGGGWGYHLGTTFRPNEQNQIGLVYHSSVKMSLTGNVQFTGLNGPGVVGIFGGPNFQASVTAPVYIPANLQLGYAFMPNERWQFEADASWFDWYPSRTLGISYSGLTANQSAVLNNPSANPEIFNGRKTLNFALGANYKASDALQLRGGGFYESASLPESTFSPAYMDLPRYSLTIGAGYAFTKNLGLDVAYDAVFFHTRHVTAPGTQDQLGLGYSHNAGYSGYFSSFSNILSASLSYRTDMHL